MWQKVRDWVDMLGLVFEMIPKYLRWYAERIEKWWAERGISTVNRAAPIPPPRWEHSREEEVEEEPVEEIPETPETVETTPEEQ